jgi:hypothetical protein
MRVSFPKDYIPAYVPPVPVVPLSPEVSKTLIENGVFQHDANEVLWTSPGNSKTVLGGPIGSAASVQLPGGASFQAYSAPNSSDPLLPSLLQAGNLMLPHLEQAAPDGIADGVALLVATPEIFRACTSSERGKAENLVLYGTNLVRLLKIANNVVPVPHAGETLEVVGAIFKLGEQVFIAGAYKKAEP